MSSRATMFSCFILQDKRRNNSQPRPLTSHFHSQDQTPACQLSSKPVWLPAAAAAAAITHTHSHSHSAALICACAVENQADDVCVHGRNEELFVCVCACVSLRQRAGVVVEGGDGRVEDSWRMLINES